MNRRLIIRPEAEVDITNAALWYEARERGVGRRLLSEFRAAIERVVTQPEAFSRIREKPRVHRVLLRRFSLQNFLHTHG
jgi:toxin ParE1/3/4